MQTILKRKKFLAETPDLIPVRETLARAKQVLGYTPSALALEDSRLGAEQIERKVAEVLESLGIEPLDLALVKKYQQEEVRKVERRGASKFVKGMHSELGEILVTLWGILGFGGLAVILIIAACLAPDKPPMSHSMAQHFFLAFRIDFAVLAAWTILMIARHKRAQIYTASWPTKLIGDYNAPIPEFALLRAMEIKSHLPDAQFGIEEVQEQIRQVQQIQQVHREVTHLPDPFLVLLYGDLKLYLDVWDEPRFEGRRTI